ncbi:MAG: O-antigen ligase family protein [Terriglobales bacterium]
MSEPSMPVLVPSQPAMAAPRWLLPAALAPVLAAVLGFGATYSWVWAPVAVALFAAVAIWIWQLATQPSRPWPWHPILIPMLAFAALVGVQWLFHLSVYPGQTLTGLVLLAACGCSFYLGLAFASRARALDSLVRVLWVFLGLLATEAVVQYFTAHGFIYWFHDASYATPVGPFVYHNHFGGCLELLLPPAAALALLPGGSGDRSFSGHVLRALPALAGLAALMISQSRGALLAVGFELLLALLLFWRDWFSSARGRGLVLALVGVSAAIMLLANPGAMLARFEHMANNRVNSFSTRLEISASALQIFRNHPWVGTGLGTFGVEYPRYQTLDDRLVYDYAHDDYAQALAETGVAGAVCILAFLGTWIWAGFRTWRGEGIHRRRRALQLACFIAMAGLLVHSFGDFEFHSQALALLFFLELGAVLAAPSPVSVDAARPRLPNPGHGRARGNRHAQLRRTHAARAGTSPL